MRTQVETRSAQLSLVLWLTFLCSAELNSLDSDLLYLHDFIGIKDRLILDARKIEICEAILPRGTWWLKSHVYPSVKLLRI